MNFPVLRSFGGSGYTNRNHVQQTPLTYDMLVTYIKKITSNESNSGVNGETNVKVNKTHANNDPLNMLYPLPIADKQLFTLNYNNIFQNHTLNRHGIYFKITDVECNAITMDIEDKNISLFLSLAYVLVDTFSVSNLGEKIIYAKTFREQVLKTVKEEDIISNISNCNFTNAAFDAIANALVINMFVLDLQHNQIYVTNANSFVPYRKNLFFVKITKYYFEPVSVNDNLVLSYEHIKAFLTDLNVVTEDIEMLAKTAVKTKAKSDVKIKAKTEVKLEVKTEEETDEEPEEEPEEKPKIKTKASKKIFTEEFFDTMTYNKLKEYAKQNNVSLYNHTTRRSKTRKAITQDLITTLNA